MCSIAPVVGAQETRAEEEHAQGAAKKARTQYKHTRQDFLQVFDKLCQELVSDDLFEGQPAASQNGFEEMLKYNVPGGKLNRGMAVLDVLTAVKKGKVLTEQEVHQANILGWCIEWLQAFFLVADDIMDGSITRRGQPCWYKVPKVVAPECDIQYRPDIFAAERKTTIRHFVRSTEEDVGLSACNDYILLECCIYRILKLHFQSNSIYTKVMELFHEVTYQTSHGQMLDLIASPPGTMDLARFKLDAYMRIITYKTAFYSFYLPVACGMLLAGCNDEAFPLAKQLCIKIGQYFQIQDDFLDCFADAEELGKIGTDIEDGKCCWLICTALQKASPEQRKSIQVHYGKKDPGSVQVIKKIYKELELDKHFETYEIQSYAELTALIKEQTLLPDQVFTSILNKIYKRRK